MPSNGREVVIIEAARTPIGRGHLEKGYYKDTHPNELLGAAYRAVIERAGIEPGQVENVISGCVAQFGPQGLHVGRYSSASAGLYGPGHVIYATHGDTPSDGGEIRDRSRVGITEVATRVASRSVRRRYLMRSAMVMNLSPNCFPTASSCGTRAIVPSSFITSASTPAG